jgi:hypothetical protein
MLHRGIFIALDPKKEEVDNLKNKKGMDSPHQLNHNKHDNKS